MDKSYKGTSLDLSLIYDNEQITLNQNEQANAILDNLYDKFEMNKENFNKGIDNPDHLYVKADSLLYLTLNYLYINSIDFPEISFTFLNNDIIFNIVGDYYEFLITVGEDYYKLEYKDIQNNIQNYQSNNIILVINTIKAIFEDLIIKLNINRSISQYLYSEIGWDLTRIPKEEEKYLKTMEINEIKKFLNSSNPQPKNLYQKISLENRDKILRFFEEMESNVCEIAELQDNWDSEGSSAIKPETIVIAEELSFNLLISLMKNTSNFEEFPEINPSGNGIDIEWDTDQFELLIHIKGEENSNIGIYMKFFDNNRIFKIVSSLLDIYNIYSSLVVD